VHVTGQLALVAIIAFGINLLPAFGPPTWALLVFLELQWDVNSVGLVLAGAVGAATGRFVLATTFRHFRYRLSPARRESLGVVAERLTEHRGRAVAGLALFAVSPLPSAQLFEAAGLLAVPLVPLTVAFFVGRVVSYSLYVAIAGHNRYFAGLQHAPLPVDLGFSPRPFAIDGRNGKVLE